MVRRLTDLVVTKARRVVATGVLLMIVAAGYGLGVFDSLGNGGFDDPASEASVELAREQKLFGNQTPDIVVLLRSSDQAVDSAAFRAEADRVVAAVPQDAVTTVVTPWTPTAEDAAGPNPALVSTDGRAAQVLISLAGDGQSELSDNADRVIPELRDVATDLRVDVGGPWAVYTGVNETVSSDLARAELITLPIVLILSLVIFGSLVAAAMPVMVGVFAVLGSLAVIRVLTLFTEVSVFSINVISLLGMGLAIDYALFIISRFREELDRYADDDPDAVPAALRTTMATAGRTVLFSALTVAAAMSALLVFPQNFLRSLGYGGVAAVAVGAVVALTILPAILRLLGRRIDAGRLPWRRQQRVTVDTEHGAWARLARGVMRRPVLVLVGVVAVLGLAASPFASVTWGSVDYRVLPPDHPAHVAADRLNDEFGGERSTASLLVENAGPAQVADVADAAAKVPGVLGVETVAQEGSTTLLRATWQGNSQTESSREIVEDLRALPEPEGSTVLVGGLSADTVDLLDSIGAKLPIMGAIIAAVMMVLLFLAFGSVVLPIKAIAMNLLSIGASFGVITWIFADGHLEGLLGYQSTGFLDATQPIFMLAILVGLSMDYEVFLLSRVREQWDRTGDNNASVAVGVQKTGRIITSAALLLGVVIGGFSTSGIVFMKMIGIGMLVALLVDATIVRALLVPATMRLLGNWNWWAPAPLARFYQRYGWREEEPPSAPTAPSGPGQSSQPGDPRSVAAGHHG